MNLQPDLPPWLGRLRVEGITIAGQRLTVAVESDRVEISGAGPIEVITRARSPLPPSRATTSEVAAEVRPPNAG